MFKRLTSLITWSKSTVKDEWETWIAWQRQQSPSHYEKSDIFQYYLSNRPIFSPPKGTCHTNKYFFYCFGDFAALIVNPTGGDNITEYLILLLDIYDVCKGMSRRFLTGDPVFVSLVREAVRTGNITPLQKFDFYQFEYPYWLLHAHTVAQNSLSTLLARLLSHYLSNVDFKRSYPEIESVHCQRPFQDSLFGAPVLQLSSPVAIPGKARLGDVKCSSWPGDNSTVPRCSKCKRITENVWGDFKACLDCHTKRICSVCGEKAIIITSDDLPKCNFHKPD